MSKSLPYRALRKVYRLFFKEHYVRWKKQKEQQRIDECTLHHTYDVRELFFQEDSPSGFNRYDVIVRLLAIEDYYGLNNYGWDMYRRMQLCRKGIDWVEGAVERFKNLILSWEQNGYDENSEVVLFNNLHWKDGSHRMAMALYHKQTTISCTILPYSENVEYGIEKFMEYGFSIEEINLLRNRYEQLKKELFIPFICTLWSPVQDYFDEITDRLSIVANVLEYKDYVFDEFNYAQMTRKIYAVDDIEKWKIEKKIEYMKSDHPTWKIRKVSLRIDYPSFRMKGSNQNTLSERCEVLKRMIRNDYLNKIPSYFHDIIMHIGDNFYQNEYINNLFSVPSSLVNEVLVSICNYDYVIVKDDVPYQSPQFPKVYPLGKDIDIYCTEDSFDKISSAIIDSLHKSSVCGAELRIVKKNRDRQLIRLELCGNLIFGFDLFRMDKEIGNLFIEERKKKNDYYITSPRCEIIARILEVYAHPNKRHHIQYLIDHKNDVDRNFCETYLPSNMLSVLDDMETVQEQLQAHTDDLAAIFTKSIDNKDVANTNGRAVVVRNIAPWIIELKCLLAEWNIPQDAICVVGSSIMATYGLRDNHDMDVIISSEYRKQYGPFLFRLNDEIEVVHEGWYTLVQHDITDDIIINDNKYHFELCGIKFATLNLLWGRKRRQEREKDLKDLELIQPLINENHSIYTGSRRE